MMGANREWKLKRKLSSLAAIPVLWIALTIAPENIHLSSRRQEEPLRTWDVLQQSGAHLHREEEEDGAPVEQVVDGGGREAQPELLQVAEVGQGDHGRGDGGPHVAPLWSLIF